MRDDASGTYTEDLLQVLDAIGVEPGKAYYLTAVREDEQANEIVVTLSPDYWKPEKTFAVEVPGSVKTTMPRSEARALGSISRAPTRYAASM